LREWGGGERKPEWRISNQIGGRDDRLKLKRPGGGSRHINNPRPALRNRKKGRPLNAHEKSMNAAVLGTSGKRKATKERLCLRPIGSQKKTGGLSEASRGPEYGRSPHSFWWVPEVKLHEGKARGTSLNRKKKVLVGNRFVRGIPMPHTKGRKRPKAKMLSSP